MGDRDRVHACRPAGDSRSTPAPDDLAAHRVEDARGLHASFLAPSRTLAQRSCLGLGDGRMTRRNPSHPVSPIEISGDRHGAFVGKADELPPQWREARVGRRLGGRAGQDSDRDRQSRQSDDPCGQDHGRDPSRPGRVSTGGRQVVGARRIRESPRESRSHRTQAIGRRRAISRKLEKDEERPGAQNDKRPGWLDSRRSIPAPRLPCGEDYPFATSPANRRRRIM